MLDGTRGVRATGQRLGPDAMDNQDQSQETTKGGGGALDLGRAVLALVASLDLVKEREIDRLLYVPYLRRVDLITDLLLGYDIGNKYISLLYLLALLGISLHEPASDNIWQTAAA